MRYVLFFVGAVTVRLAPLVLSAGLLLSGYVALRRDRKYGVAALICFVLALFAVLEFRFLWGWHQLFGWRFVLNEYDVPALIGLLQLAGWACIGLGFRRRPAQPTRSG